MTKQVKEIRLCLLAAQFAVSIGAKTQARVELCHALAIARHLPSNSKWRALRGHIAQAWEACQ